MKIRLLAILLTLAAAGVALPPTPARAQDEKPADQQEVSFDFFYDSLRPYGEWIQVADYGLCWKPKDVGENWAPYTDGYWAYTDAGWTWVSYEDFGGIVYHYGRWTNVEDEGWCWVPDYEWGPAWVAWRSDDEHVGWAPLPPEAKFDREVGVSTWVDEEYDIGPSYYNFCRIRDFGAPVLVDVLLPEPEVIEIVRYCPPVTNIVYYSDYGFPFCGGPRFDYISEHCYRPIPTLALVRETNIVNINNTIINNRVVYQNQVRGNTLRLPAPRMRRPATNPGTNPRFAGTRTLPAARVNRGWNRVPPNERPVIRAAYQKQTGGATRATRPARPVTQAELKPVPKPNPTAPLATRRPPTVRPDGAVAGPNRTPGAPGTRPGTPGGRPGGGAAPGLTPGVTPGGAQGITANPPRPGDVTPGAVTPGAGKAGAGKAGAGKAGAGIAGADRPDRPDRPGAGSERPDRPDRPGVGADRPIAGADRGKAGADRPAGGERPGGADRPAGPAGLDRAAGADRPAGVDRPGIVGAGRPDSDGPGVGKAGAGKATGKAGPGAPGTVRPPASLPSRAIDDTPRTARVPGSDDSPRSSGPIRTPGSDVPRSGATRLPDNDGPRTSGPIRTPGSDVPRLNPSVNRPPVSIPQNRPSISSSGPRPAPRPSYETPLSRPQPRPQVQAPVPRPQAQPQYSRPQPQISRPQPQISRPQPQISRPQPQISRPQPQYRPQPQMPRPQPQISRPQPQIQRPQPQMVRPQPQMARPQQVPSNYGARGQEDPRKRR